MAEKGNLKQDDLIAKLVKDPKAPPDALLLSGFLGASSEDDHTRLYLTATLDDYVEIPSDAILHTQEIPKDQSPLGGTLLWIKKDAELIHGKVGPNRTKAKFLEGRIQQEFVKAQAAGAAGVPGIQAITLPQQCLTVGPQCPTLNQVFCPTHHPPCTVVGPNCITHHPPCTAVGPGCPTAGPTILPCCHPSLAAPCPSHPLIACPTNPIICTHLGPQCHPSLIVPGCTHFGPECPIHTIAPPCPIHTLAPPCQVGSGPFCGGQPGGPVEGPGAFAHAVGAQAALGQPEAFTIVCTKVGPACPTHHVGCSVALPQCGITTPQECQIASAFCPTPACPTHHVACTIALPACGQTLPAQCQIQSAFCPVTAPPQCPIHTPFCPVTAPPQCPIHTPLCPVTAPPQCPVPLTHHPPICHLSALAPCQTLPHIQCLPSVAHPCPTLAPAGVCGHSVLTPCVTQVCTIPPQCPVPTGFACPPQTLVCPFGGGGVGPGPVAGGAAHAAAFGAVPQGLHFSAPPICVPINTLVGCPTQHFIQCHPTILCPVHTPLCPIQSAFCPVTLAGCPIQTQFCPSAFCPSIACGFGGFGGFGQ